MFNIPDLSNLESYSSIFFINYFLRGRGPTGHEAYGLILNYIRLTDLAVSEYEYGRRALLRYADGTKGLAIASMIRATSHFEVCIDTLKRAINLLKAVKGNSKMPQTIKAVFPRG